MTIVGKLNRCKDLSPSLLATRLNFYNRRGEHCSSVQKRTLARVSFCLINFFFANLAFQQPFCTSSFCCNLGILGIVLCHDALRLTPDDR